MSQIKLPHYWNMVRLGEVCRVFSGYAFKSSDFTKKGIPIVKIGNLQNGLVILNEEDDYVPKAWVEKAELKKFLLKPNDVVIALTGATTGKVAVIGANIEVAFLNQRVGKIELISLGADLNFILAVIHAEAFQKAIQQSILKSAQGNVSPSAIEQINIPLPPFPEQRAIARALWTVQVAREARRRELELERDRKAALMQYLFTYGTRSEPRKQTEIGEIPASWQVVRLGNLIIEGPQNGVYKPLELYGEGTPIVRINDFDNDGAFVSLDFKKVLLLPEEIDRYCLLEGDILINRVNSLSHLGKCTIVPKLLEATVFESNMMRLHVDEARLIPEYLLRYLVTGGSRERVRSMARRAVAQSSINQGDVMSLLVPLPSISEQQEIVAVLRACDAKVTMLEQEAVMLEELFRAMLEELMTGRLSALPLIDAEANQ